MVEINQIQEKIKNVLIKNTEESRGDSKYYSIEDIEIETNDAIFFLDVGFNISANDGLSEFCINNIGIQFADFEGMVDEKYVNQIEKYFEGMRLYY
jgi:hypothetical protein